MLTKIKKVFFLVIIASFALVLAGCKDELTEALESLVLEAEVSEDFNLPSVNVEGAYTTWTSSNEDVIKIEGTYAEVYRPAKEDANVVLTATAELGEKSVSKEFTVTVKKLDAPDALTIKTKGKDIKYCEELDAYFFKINSTAELLIEVAEDTMNSEVVWASSDAAVVSVENGAISAKSYGEVTVVATSSSDSTIKASITIIVSDYLRIQDVLISEADKIVAQIPRFITSDYTFPEPENDEIKVTYLDFEYNEIVGGEYIYYYEVDRTEKISCNLVYAGVEYIKFFEICVVADETNNEFLALDYAEEKMRDLFKPYTEDGQLIDGDIDVINAISADEAKFDVKLSYTFVTNYAVAPLTAKDVIEGETVKHVVKYVKPNDDLSLRMEVYVSTANVGRNVLINLNVKGYTQEEIVEYITANVLPQPNAEGKYVVKCANILLPKEDTTNKFKNLSISWSSSNESALTSEGKFADPYTDVDAEATLTATITYNGTVSSKYEFVEEVSLEYSVLHADNDIQVLAMQLSESIMADEFMSKVKHFPYGVKDREGGNVLPLPKTVKEIRTDIEEYADTEITWTANEEGLLDENYKLLKQYLRYHEVTLTYSVTDGTNVATGEILINVGVTEVKNTIYIGGPFFQQSASDEHATDMLHYMSKFDEVVGAPGSKYATTGGEQFLFSGLTFYVDVYVLDDDGNKTDVFTRYQYFTSKRDLVIMDDQFSVELEDPENTRSGVVKYNAELNPYMSHVLGNNWHCVYVNISDHDIKVPMAPLVGDPFLGSEVKWADHPWAKAQFIERSNSISYDGYRPGFITDANGTVVLGYGSQFISPNYDANNDGLLTEDDYWLTIPAGGYGYTPKSQQNGAHHVIGNLCVKGETLTFIQLNPYGVE